MSSSYSTWCWSRRWSRWCHQRRRRPGARRRQPRHHRCPALRRQPWRYQRPRRGCHGHRRRYRHKPSQKQLRRQATQQPQRHLISRSTAWANRSPQRAFKSMYGMDSDIHLTISEHLEIAHRQRTNCTSRDRFESRNLDALRVSRIAPRGARRARDALARTRSNTKATPREQEVTCVTGCAIRSMSFAVLPHWKTRVGHSDRNGAAISAILCETRLARRVKERCNSERRLPCCP